jgi:hypothetical protein
MLSGGANRERTKGLSENAREVGSGVPPVIMVEVEVKTLLPHP